MSKKSNARRGYARRQKYNTEIFASPEAAKVAEEASLDLVFGAGEALYGVDPTGSGGLWKVGDVRKVLVAHYATPVHIPAPEERSMPLGAPEPATITCGECQQEIPSDQFEEHWAAEHAELQLGPGVPFDWRRVLLEIGRVVAAGLCLGLAVVAGLVVRFNYTAGYRDPVVLGLFSMFAFCFGALAGLLFYPWLRSGWQWLRHLSPRMPKVSRPSLKIPQRPTWLRMPSISRPQIQFSWPSNWPHPSRREVALACLAVALIATGILIVNLWPIPKPVQVVGRLATQDGGYVPDATIVVNGAYTTTTNVDGVFAIPGIPKADEYTLEITTADGDYLEWAATPSGYLTSPGQDDLGELRIVPVAEAAAPITVTVVGRLESVEGHTVAGVTVSVGDSKTTTDDHGLFEVPDVLEADSYNIVIDTAEGDHLEIAAEPKGSLTGPSMADLGGLRVVPVAAVAVVEPEAEAEAEVETEAEVEVELEVAAREHTVTVKDGDTVWDLLTEELGYAPTWEQIKSVVGANDLVDKGVNDAGLWIVLIHAGQTIDLSPALGG